MEKRLYIKPKTLINDIILQSVIAGSETGIIESGLAKDREDDEFEIEKEDEKVPTEYSLW
jgi:hypothetical protein